MNDQPIPPARHPDSSTTPHLIAAFFRNQERWLERLSTGEPSPTLPHIRLRREGSVLAVRTGRSGVICLEETAPEETPDLGDFEQTWSWLRSYGPQDVLLWSPVERPAMSLALQARGFDLSFRPTWMGRSLTGDLPMATATARGVHVRIATPADIDELRVTTAIPYLVPDQVETTRRLALAPENRAVAWLIARDRHGVVGQAIVNLTEEVAGLYNVAVHPDARRRGIGRALTTEAMAIARDSGASRMALNATHEGLGLYRGLGFEHLGDGMTWFLPATRSRLAPDPALVQTAMALGSGCIDGLDEDHLPTRLPNGDLPMTFAARFGQHETVSWLLERGADRDIVALWDLGLQHEAMRAMSDPAAVNRPTGPERATPLHFAVRRGDLALAELLIAAGADLTIRDTQFRATPLGWAEYLDRPILVRMIWRAGGR